MTTRQTVIEAVNQYADNVESGRRLLQETVMSLTRTKQEYEQTITGLRSIEASLQADLKEKREVIQAQHDRIIELAAYCNQLKEEIGLLKSQKATDERVALRNGELYEETQELKERNKHLSSRCLALDNRVQQQKEEIDGLKFAMHKAGM